jgi:hypothetical protein
VSRPARADYIASRDFRADVTAAFVGAREGERVSVGDCDRVLEGKSDRENERVSGWARE